jgi:hypothetical protein
MPNVEVQGSMQIQSLLMHARPRHDGAHDLAATIRGIRRTSPGRPPLDIDLAELTGTLTGDRKLNVSNIALQSAATRYWGSGALELDGSRRIEGKLTTQTNDLDGLLDIASPQFGISDEQRQGIRTLLGILGGKAQADIVAKNGELYMGPIKIGNLAPLY